MAIGTAIGKQMTDYLSCMVQPYFPPLRRITPVLI
jgi:hypothetical protein